MDLTRPRSLPISRGDGAMAEAIHGSRWWWWSSPTDRAVPPEGVMEGTQAPHRVLLEL